MGTPVLYVNAEIAADLAAMVDLFDRIPGELITVSGTRQVELLSSVARIRQVASNPPRGKDLSLRSEGLTVIGLIKRALAECPDEAPGSHVGGLEFISDPDYRRILRLDMGSASSAVVNGEWKAATVISGSVIEALLLWTLSLKQNGDEAGLRAAIEQVSADPKAKCKKVVEVEKWGLWQYIAVSRQLDIIAPRDDEGM